MRQNLILAAFLLINALWQPTFSQSHDIKINVGNAMLYELMGFYEYGINENTSISAFGGYVYGLPVSSRDPYDHQYQMFVHYGYFGPEFRYYVRPREGCDGFFFGGYMRYKTGYSDVWLQQYGTLKSTSPEYPNYPNGDYNYSGMTKQDFNKLGLGFTFGGKWVKYSGFIFGVFGGFGRNLFANYSEIENLLRQENFIQNTEYHYYETSFWDSQYWDLRIGFNIGWRLDSN